ncbi:MAG: hypothetical protein LH477_14545 [Nocardioides sp.]|nr:hypothetical protein [Nocardioides sp.]
MGARLIVIPDVTRDGMFARVSGTLGINDKGCFTLDDRVLVVGKGSRVLPGADSIEVADVGVVDVGTRTSGGGGYIDGVEEVERIADAMDLGDDVMACQPDGADTSLTVLDPPTP